MRYLTRIVSPLLMLSALLPCMETGMAQAQPLSNRGKWGVSNDWGIRDWLFYNQSGYSRAGEAGFGVLRYWLYWDMANPQPGVYDWDVSDKEINDAISQGFEVYVNIMWAPPYAVGGTEAYKPWYCGTTEFYSAKYACDNRMPNVNDFKNFVTEAVRRYSDRVRYWGFWNEPNYPVFWHADVNDYWHNLDLLVDNISIPGAEAARTAAQAEGRIVTIVGPEPDSPEALSHMLAREAQSGKRVYDVISFHQYPINGTVADMLSDLDRYNAPGGALASYRNGRPVWVTESGAKPDIVYGILEGVDQRTWVDRYFYHSFKSIKCLPPPPSDPICQTFTTSGDPGENEMVDLVDVRLPTFFPARSYMTGRTSVFTTQTPEIFGNASPGYEVATQFSSSRAGTIKTLRFYRAQGETGTNTLRLWSDTGALLASATYAGTGTGWQEVSIGGVLINANTRYRVSVNTNAAQSKTNCGIGSGITVAPLTAHQGFWGQPMGAMPTNASCSNFFVDVVFDRGANLFTTQTPGLFGAASPGYEVATQFSASRNGVVKALRFYRPAGETGINTLRLWTDTGIQLASATYTGTGTGWVQVALGGVGGVPITAGVRYRVSVNTNTVQSKTNCGIGSGITNGPLTAHQGFWGQPMGSMPTNPSCSNFFADVVFD